MNTTQTLYIAGPMRGYPRFNFDAFYEAEAMLQKGGYEVLNPARMDADIGFNPDTDVPDKAFLDEAMRRDFEAVMKSDGVVMLPGWEKSVGAKAEMGLARWRRIPVYSFPDMKELPSEDALKQLREERGKIYGDPQLSHENIGMAWTGLIQQHFSIRLAKPIPSFLVSLMMVQFKAQRSARVYHQDNFDDLHVYAQFAQEAQAPK